MTDDLIKYLLAAADDSPFEPDKKYFTAAAHYIKRLESTLRKIAHAPHGKVFCAHGHEEAYLIARSAMELMDD